MFLYKKQVVELERIFEHNKALLSSHINTIVTRLESVANRNILFAEIHNTYKTKYNDLKENLEPQAQNAIDSLKDLLATNNNKGYKAIIGTYQGIILAFEKSVGNLTRDLEQVMEQEEQIRNKVFSKKEEVRLLKSTFLSKQHELRIVEKTFERLFLNLDANLIKLDDFIEIADFGESDLLIGKLTKILSQVSTILIDLPKLCVMVEKIVPEKIISVKEEIERLNKQNYPTHNLLVKNSLDRINEELTGLKSRLCEFDINGVYDSLNDILTRLDSFFVLFEQEKLAKVTFEQEYEATYATVNEIERRFIKLNNSLPELRKMYMVEDIHLSKIDEIRNHISNLNLIKRGLDTLVNASTRQPYSLQVKKILQLKSESSLALSLMETFSAYLGSLKTLENDAKTLLMDFFPLLKKAQHRISELGVPAYQAKANEIIVVFYDSFRQIAAALQVNPINMNIVMKHVQTLNIDAKKWLLQVDQDVNMALLAENAIVFANRDRHRLNDYHRLLTMSESIFLEGNFEKAYLEAGNLLKKIQNQTNRSR